MAASASAAGEDSVLMLCYLALCLAVVTIASSVCSAADAGAALGGIRPHPRLLARESDIERLRALLASDDTARVAKPLGPPPRPAGAGLGAWHDDLRAQAASILNQAPVRYELIGPRLLHISRQALTRITTLGLLYRLDGDRSFADRAIRELMTVCAFPDWHPPHFLDTAEMTNAAAIGYDWLFDLLTPEQRAVVKQAIIEKGLRPALALYERGGWWVAVNHNWNQVCNGGIAIGALAIADEEPALAAQVLDYALASLPKALAEYEPDGGWSEGPGYWHYATRYTVYLLAALDSALGTDFGLSDRPGLARAGDFRMYCVGPLDRTFNYADAGDGAGRAAEMFWLARRYGKPAYAWHERRRAGHPDAFDLLWYDPAGQAPADWPLDKAFRHIEVAFFRGAWDDSAATFVGFKGGDNRANHSHLDLGTFVLDALGQRWALDLGGDDYNLPGYFGKQRFTYYRLSTEGQNTLTIASPRSGEPALVRSASSGDNQDAAARAPIIAFHSTPRRAFAVADLSAAYPGARRVWRGIALLRRRDVLIEDEIEADEEMDVAWGMHTPAKVELTGDRCVLTQSGESLHLRILSPHGAQFATASADPGPPQNRNEGVTKLLIRLPGVKSVRLAVLLSPQEGLSAPTLAPLSEWLEVAQSRNRTRQEDTR